ncbi:hypothetical protein SRB5_21390 [Streptomyces sp. RB5]|uniref:ATP synthase protein I n=1 Tax=Streptomyces smaragdinus TaxID=2585196 RepID=A0A7K0CEW2_9ACTN|nr:hypothetical protein [Streptomyces smaragdinus]MQY12010.1 hypothetical protein [Streptomyces smaragdinus]
MQVNDARVLRGAAIPTALAGIVAVIISSLAAGAKGAVGAAAATAVVLVFFALGLFVLQRFTRKYPEMMMAVGLVTYMTQVLALGIVLAAFKDTTLFNTRAFGLTVLGTALVWTAAMARGYLREKTLYVEPESPRDDAEDTAGKGQRPTGAP